ncbi:MAG: hypothetical protein WBP72_10895 [Rhodocyclaceae bacterium]
MKTKISKTIAAISLGALFSTLAYGQTTDPMLQRNINQQHRIEQGLESGQLNTREAARLERKEAVVNRMESRALRDGTVSEAEQQRIDRAQDNVSRDIYREKHDAQIGNPDSASSQRMQAGVQRNINQQQRIQQGVQSGALTNREAARLERGQARVNRREARAGADGWVGPGEQRRIQRAENRQSRHIWRQKHDRQVRH